MTADQPRACTWPACLTPAQQTELADQVTASMLGEPTTPGPDQRPICGCREPHICGNCEGVDPDSCLLNPDRREPDNETATALARHIASHPVGDVQAAYRLLGMELAFEVRDDTPAPGTRPGPDLSDWNSADDASYDTELTAEEARELVTSLGTDLYRAEDALAFVGEMCDIADRNGLTEVPIRRVRRWLEGVKCGRQMIAEAATTTASLTPKAPQSGDAAPAFTWAESVASYGIGPTAVIDIDVHAPGHDEPVPVEIPIAKARELYAHLGGILAEHGVTPRTARLRERLERAHTEAFKLARQITDLRCELSDERTRAEQAEAELSGLEETAADRYQNALHWQERAEEAEAQVAAVRELHREWKRNPDDKHPGYCAHCEKDGDVVRYPCSTLRALEGTEPTT